MSSWLNTSITALSEQLTTLTNSAIDGLSGASSLSSSEWQQTRCVCVNKFEFESGFVADNEEPAKETTKEEKTASPRAFELDDKMVSVDLAHEHDDGDDKMNHVELVVPESSNGGEMVNKLLIVPESHDIIDEVVNKMVSVDLIVPESHDSDDDAADDDEAALGNNDETGAVADVSSDHTADDSASKPDDVDEVPVIHLPQRAFTLHTLR